MAFLKYRGSTTTPGTWTSTLAANAPLANDDIDKNFASLDAQKLDLTGGTITGPLAVGTNLTADLKDDQVYFIDGADTSKKLGFQLSGITTATTRTLTIPDKDGTIAVTSDLTLGRVTGATVGSATSTDQVISLTNTTDSTSTSTGALKVSGGVAVGKNLYVGGNLTVAGTTTTIDSTTVTVADKNIELGKVTTPTDATADGGGITLLGATNKTITWDSANTNWTSSENLNIPSNKSYKVNNTVVLSGTSLGAGVVSSSLASVGTLTTGTWNATTIGATYGGTGINSYAAGDIVYASAVNTLSKLAKSTDGKILKLVSGLPAWDTEYSYTLPTATSSVLGGVKLVDNTAQTVAANSVSTTASRSYAVQLNASSQMLVNVPWTDTTYTQATSTALGLIKLGSDTAQTVAANTPTSTASRTYALQVNASGQGLVNVPWTDTTYTQATNAVLGLIKLGSDTTQTTGANSVTSTAGRTYAVQVDSTGHALVNIPWINTTYSAGTGLSLVGDSFSVSYGTTASTACVGNDSRLSDARTPTTHTHAAGDITSGTMDTARLGSGTASSTTYLRGDSTWATVQSGASLSDDTTTNSDARYPIFASATTGAPTTVYVSSTKYYYNPSTGTLNATNFNSLSDARAKKDLEVIQNALTKVTALTGYTFTMIDGGQRASGLIAQDVEVQLPEVVGGTEDQKNVNYGAMMGLIVEAIKELNSKVDALQNQINNK